MNNITLTTSQQRLLKQITSFFSSEEGGVFILKGYAGTGKTTMMKSMVDYLHTDKLRHTSYKTVLMAPTGRAAVILSQKTGYVANTIHRTIYKIEEGAQEVGGKMKFMLRHNEDSEQTVYFVDESSMISDIPSDNDMFKFGSGCLLQDLLQYCGNRKIVFVGDTAQLPPVGQKISPALDVDYLTQKYHRNVTSATLKEVVRQAADSGIYSNAMSIRTSIENGIYNEFGIISSEDVSLSHNLFEDYITETLSQVSKESIIVTYSNAKALEYNKRIRSTIFRQTTERLVAGDLLIISRNNYAYIHELFNGTIVSVAACAPDSQLEARKVRFFSREKDSSGNSIVKEVELVFRNVTLELDDGKLLKCKILDSFITDEDGTPGIDISQALHVDFTMRRPDLKKGTDVYYDALKHDPFLNAVICKYGYAITCHKAQGGEWKNVFVDMSREQGKQNSDFFRWAYTAVTRSSSRLWIANAPKFNLFSEMQIGTIAKGGNMEFYTPTGENFLDYRFARISKKCEELGLNCHENRGVQFQHVLTITDNHGGCCVVQIWYGKNGYTGRDKIVQAEPQELSDVVKSICNQSLIPDEVPFILNDDRMIRLYGFVQSVSVRVGLTILNVVNLPYIDRFFMTNGHDYEVVSFSYNSKKLYTSCTLQSSAGTSDEELIKFRCMIERTIQ